MSHGIDYWATSIDLKYTIQSQTLDTDMYKVSENILTKNSNGNTKEDMEWRRPMKIAFETDQLVEIAKIRFNWCWLICQTAAQVRRENPILIFGQNNKLANMVQTATENHSIRPISSTFETSNKNHLATTNQRKGGKDNKNLLYIQQQITSFQNAQYLIYSISLLCCGTSLAKSLSVVGVSLFRSSYTRVSFSGHFDVQDVAKRIYYLIEMKYFLCALAIVAHFTVHPIFLLRTQFQFQFANNQVLWKFSKSITTWPMYAIS